MAAETIAVRILQICAVDFTAYHFLAPLMRHCREAGMTVEFGCAPGPWAVSLEAEGFPHRAIPISRGRSPWLHARAALILAHSLRRDPPDLVHTHTPIGGLVGRAATLAVPGIPVAHTFHGLPFEGGRTTATTQAFLTVERMLARRTSFFFSQAAGDAQRAVALGIARAGDLLVIGNGADTDRFAPDPAARAAVRDELGVPADAVLVTTVGRLVREKGHLELADAALACADVPDLHVAVVGRALASDREPVGEALDTHPVVSTLGPRWHLLGHRTDVDRLLSATDIFVLASYREGLPRSVIEAMASGVAVIASDIPACRELVEPDVTGILVPPRDPHQLATALRALLLDPARRRAMGRHGRERAIARFRERDVLERQLPVLMDLART